MWQLLRLIGIKEEWLVEQCGPILTRLDEIERLARENVDARRELTEELKRWNP